MEVFLLFKLKSGNSALCIVVNVTAVAVDKNSEITIENGKSGMLDYPFKY